MSSLTFLSLFFSLVAANLGSYQNFTFSCESIYSFGEEHRNISAVCSRDAVVSLLDLNDCIGNVQGQLVCSNHKYLSTCWDCTFTQSAIHEPAWMECSCDTNYGIYSRVAKNLNDCVGNDHGQLRC
ncbi:hypothetical protein KVR01_002326 [Diaporthe batatas]|uniref:uncharacterized protein n=1 Tax=Diaporthe batatas TaxID=748121 RepID=UPI001D046A4E|nr:uncharacterized protein KVR01_002326 [Diaporthe batatas]KAG8166637.1 hypothetical protein KVR01_002326 [Diaporthe batatas]